MPVRAQVQLCKVGVRDTVTKAAKGVSKKRAAHVQASGSQVRRWQIQAPPIKGFIMEPIICVFPLNNYTNGAA